MNVMVYEVYLGFICVVIVNSVQGIKPTSCGLSVKNAKIELRCTCGDGDIPYGAFCFPAEVKCPNGYWDIFEETCKCIRYKNENDTSSGCVNLCDDGCVNGVCIASAPGKCECNEGYSLSESNKCEPICEGGCTNSFCMYPNWCSCYHGYSRIGMNECAPVCSKGCTNGVCIGPEICMCDDGYSQTNEGQCEEDEYTHDE